MSFLVSFSFFYLSGALKKKKNWRKKLFSPLPSCRLASHEPWSHRQHRNNCTGNHTEDSSSLFPSFQVVLKKHRPFWMFSQICTRQAKAIRYLAGAETHRHCWIWFLLQDWATDINSSFFLGVVIPGNLNSEAIDLFPDRDGMVSCTSDLLTSHLVFFLWMCILYNLICVSVIKNSGSWQNGNQHAPYENEWVTFAT